MKPLSSDRKAFLRDALRGTGDSLPNTVRRMTGAIADRFRIPQRGYVREGSFQLDVNADHFLYESTTKRKIEDNTQKK